MITSFLSDSTNCTGVILSKEETLVECRECKCVYVIHTMGIYDCPDCGRNGTKFNPIYGDQNGDTGGGNFVHSEKL